MTASETKTRTGVKNGPKRSVKSKSTGIISSKNTVAGQNAPTKWPNVWDPMELTLISAPRPKSKPGKSGLCARTGPTPGKRSKLSGNVVGKKTGFGARNSPLS